MYGLGNFQLCDIFADLYNFDVEGGGGDCLVLVRCFSVVAERCFACPVFEIAKVFHKPFPNAAPCLSYVGGSVVWAVLASDFVNGNFCMAFPCQARLTRVACAVSRRAGWRLQG